MRVRELLLAASMLLVGLAGCVNGSADLAPNPIAPCGQLDDSFDVDAAATYDPRVRFATSNGTIEMVVYKNQVPITAGNFLSLVQEGFYDGTRFHLLRPGTFIQGGDPNSASDNRRLWGTGGPGYSIPDEFHESLRHDEPGTLSMATAQPNSGGSQFLLSLRPLPGLDDRSAVFGQVEEGLDVVHRISEMPTDENRRPLFGAKLHEAQILPPEEDPTNTTVSLSSRGLDCEQAAEPNGTAQFLVNVRNTGFRVLNGTTETQTPAGDWSVDVRNADQIAIPSGQTAAYIVDVEVPEDASEGSHTVNVTFSDKTSDASTTRELTVNVGTLGERPDRGDEVAIRYVGVLEDGRAFDTTIETYAGSSELTWFRDPPTHLEPLEITLDESPLIPGLTKLAEEAKVGQSVVGSVSPDDGYGANRWGQNNLGGRLLIFQLEVLPADSVDASEPPSVPSDDGEGGPPGGAA